jgi:hypothetical protein
MDDACVVEARSKRGQSMIIRAWCNSSMSACTVIRNS